MNIEIDATYRAGAIHPDQPLALPENTPVRVVVQPRIVSTTGLSREKTIAMRPAAPRFTADQLNALIEKYSVSVGSLPPDFSREDIYVDRRG